MTPDEVDELIDEGVPATYRYLLRLTGDPAAAEDLVQETCLAVVRELRRNPAAELRIGWMITTARRRHIDRLRRRNREAGVLDRFASQAATPADTDDTDAADTDSLAILDALGGDQRTALVLRYVDGMSVAQVAEELGRSVTATESLLARARRRLTKMLERVNHDR